MSFETDTAFVHRCLEERPHTTMELIHRSYAERRCGLTPHSRVSDLRQRLPEGWRITCTRIPGHRRAQYRYTLVPPVAQLTLEGAA